MLPIHCAKKPYEKLADGTIQEVEVPYDIPKSWESVRLGNIISVKSGTQLKKSEMSPHGKYRVHGANGYIGFYDKYNVDTISFIIGRVGFYAGSIHIIKDKSWITDNALIVSKLYVSSITDKWLFYSLNFLKLNQISQSTAQPVISGKNIYNQIISLPPLAEQKRIVAKIEELLSKVDIYAESYNKLQELDKNFPDKLKKSILQYAMQGKLVPQDPDDEPVEVLLEKIKAEKQKLYEEGKLKKKDLEELVVTKGDDNSPYKEVPYSIPRSWKWVRLNDITSYIQRGKSPKYSTIPKYPVIAQKCNQWSGFSIELAKFVSPDTVDSYQEERLLKDGDLMWNSTGLGTLGRLAIYSEVKNPYGWAVADSHVTIIRLLLKFIDYHFIYHFLASPIVQNVIEEQASGSTKQKELATTTVKNYLIPLPPLTEQQRIVSKISQVFSVIESLV